MNPYFDRKGFLALTGATSLAAFMAACGGSSSTGPQAPADGAGASSGGTPAAPSFDPASEQDGTIDVFTWAGYDDSPVPDGAPWMWSQYQQGPYGSKSPLKFTFLDDDTTALSKVASGYSPDIIHPCGGYILKWQEAGLIQALDTTLLPDWAGIPESLKKPGLIDGLYYHLPFDVGFTALTYDADAVDFSAVGGEETWKILLDDRYRGKMSIFRGPDEVIEIAHLANETSDPINLTIEQIAAAKDTALKIKDNLRNYWTAQTETVNDFINGNLLVTSTWPDGYWKIKNHPKMKGRNIKYMQPVEGRLAWVCGMVLSAATKQPGRASMAMASADTPVVGAALTDIFQYASGQQNGVMDLIKDKALVKAFSIDDPTAWAPPKAWFEAPLPNYKDFVSAGEEVKSA